MPPPTTIHLWLTKHPEFWRMYQAACARRAQSAAFQGRRDPGLGGGQSAYTLQTAERICALVAEGMSLREIGAMDGMPCVTTLLNWKNEHEAFERMYLAAWEAHAQDVGRELVRIADEALARWTAGPEFGAPRATAALALARLKIAARIQRVQKLAPKTLLRAEKAKAAGKAEPELTYAERLALLK